MRGDFRVCVKIFLSFRLPPSAFRQVCSERASYSWQAPGPRCNLGCITLLLLPTAPRHDVPRYASCLPRLPHDSSTTHGAHGTDSSTVRLTEQQREQNVTTPLEPPLRCWYAIRCSTRLHAGWQMSTTGRGVRTNSLCLGQAWNRSSPAPKQQHKQRHAAQHRAASAPLRPRRRMARRASPPATDGPLRHLCALARACMHRSTATRQRSPLVACHLRSSRP